MIKLRCRYLRAAQASQSVSSGAAPVCCESKLTQQDLQDVVGNCEPLDVVGSHQLLNILNFLNTSIWACLKIMMP